ncbi:hypothetical protein [Azohydromonas lata]|uniref:Uncharacterized protein n=1 Tax=Azohydromonas lata TaxID=45677 RepID=A0ABU5IEI7_9BURK|nr:hypothetical protein [Azohydromonas lata]MDZ5457543.1 hypothetical protein [Azohydromonas lata]
MTKSPYDHFLQKAKKLEESRFWTWLTSRRGEPDWDRVKQGDWLAQDKLNPDEMEAFCLNLRLLIQDQDGFSIRKIKQLSDLWPEKYKENKIAIQKTVDELNTKLDQPSFVNPKISGITTNKELFDIIFYGGIAHANPSKRDEFDRITQSGLFSVFAFQAFSSVIFHYRNCIVSIAYQVATYLDEEEARSKKV